MAKRKKVPLPTLPNIHPRVYQYTTGYYSTPARDRNFVTDHRGDIQMVGIVFNTKPTDGMGRSRTDDMSISFPLSELPGYWSRGPVSIPPEIPKGMYL